VLSRLGVPEALGQTEINDVYVVLLLADTNEKVIRLDISVEEVARVNKFDSLKLKSIVRFQMYKKRRRRSLRKRFEFQVTYHLIGQHQDCLEREFTLAVIEQVLKAGTQKIYDHDIVVTLDSEPMNIRDTD
jgi:hypothetical protein